MKNFAIGARSSLQHTSVRIALFVALALTVFSFSGCPKGSKALATASASVSHALLNAQQAVAIGVQDQVLSPQDEQKFNEYVAKAATAGLILDQGIRANESAASLSPKVNAFLDAFNSLNTQGVLGIKDAKTRLAVSTALTGAETAVAIIAATVGK